MPLLSTEWRDTGVDVELWRDYDPVVQCLPGMRLGTRTLDGAWRQWATKLYEAGARCVRIAEPVTLCGTASARSARTLVLIRELTSRGFAVEWAAGCGDGCAALRRFNHLYPPAGVAGAPEEVTRDWRATFFPCKCVFRRGPGFIEVRDRRLGSLETFTIDDPRHIAAIEAMEEGVAADEVPADVRRDLAEADLLAEHAGHLWWLPMRVHRWPFPSLSV